MINHWFYFDSGPGEPAFNMALDDALLQSIAALGAPVLRLYGWTEPAATFGYFQKIATLEAATQLRPLIRRPTGGGLVAHANDWTYSLTVPPGHPWYELRAEASYARMHRWLQAAFGLLDLPTELASCCRKEIPGQCFAGYEKFDLLHCGRKLAGAAQRRNQLGLLIQGSIQPPPAALSRGQFVKAMIDSGDSLFCGRAHLLAPGAELIHRAQRLRERRAREDYHRRR
jgi:lipoyl(octanoyl) transferase